MTREAAALGPVRAVLLDLDGTLLSEGATSHALGTVIRAVAAEHGLDAATLARDLAAAWDREWTDDVELTWSRGLLTRDVLADVWADALARQDQRDPAVAAAAAGRYRAAQDDAFTPFGDVAAALDLLEAAGLPMVVVTNGDSALQRRKVRALGLVDRVGVVVSGDDGLPKPDPRIFARALDAAGCRPGDRALHVGDSLPSDVAGALGARLVAVWLDREGRGLRPGDPRPHATIRSLAELAPLIGQADSPPA